MVNKMTNSIENEATVNVINLNESNFPEVPEQECVEKVPINVKDFLDKYYPQGLVYHHNTFLAYSDGYWKRQQDRVDIQKAITKFYGSSATSKDVKALFSLLQMTNSISHEDFKPNTNYICFLNGCLDMTSFKLVPHNPGYHLQSGRNVEWDENAKAPNFEQFLQDVFRDDEDREDKIQFIIEWMGLCLIPDTKYEKFVVCVGEGGNGKSVLLKLMPELVGQANVYNAPLQRLGNRRALAELSGKLLLTSSEINENTVMDDGILKQIVSGDTVEGERKYEPPFTFTPYARIMLATNHLPKLRDVTHAFFRRLVMIKFNRNFTAEEMDMNLSATLKTELAGIFAMIVKGLRTLQDRGNFVVPKSSVIASEEYLEDSDTITKFADESLRHAEGENKGIRPVNLYFLYNNWCTAHGITGKEKASNIVLGKKLTKLGFHKKRSNGFDYWLVQTSTGGDEITSKRSTNVVTFPTDSVKALEVEKPLEITEDRLSA
jgi:putative DNA primase/helicase